MNIRYPVEINIHGELVDSNGVVLAKDVVTGALQEVVAKIILNKKRDVVR